MTGVPMPEERAIQEVRIDARSAGCPMTDRLRAGNANSLLRSLCSVFLLGIALVCGGCDAGEAVRGTGDGTDLSDVSIQDRQFLKILHQHSFRDTLDTFTGRLTKDLILDGTVSIRFWLARAEQESLLTELERKGFFAMPDTLFPMPGVFMTPNPGPDFLRVEADGAEKTVVWFYPLDQTVPANQAILRVSAAIRRIVESRREYKELPEPRGGYV